MLIWNSEKTSFARVFSPNDSRLKCLNLFFFKCKVIALNSRFNCLYASLLSGNLSILLYLNLTLWKINRETDWDERRLISRLKQWENAFMLIFLQQKQTKRGKYFKHSLPFAEARALRTIKYCSFNAFVSMIFTFLMSTERERKRDREKKRKTQRMSSLLKELQIRCPGFYKGTSTTSI